MVLSGVKTGRDGKGHDGKDWGLKQYRRKRRLEARVGKGREILKGSDRVFSKWGEKTPEACNFGGSGGNLGK